MLLFCVECNYSGTSVHERLSSRTNFPKKKKRIGSRTVSRVTNTEAGNNGWRQVGSIGGRVSVAVKLSLSTHSFGLRTFRVTNGLQERIKFENRGSAALETLKYHKEMIHTVMAMPKL
jgi:hypothetical protein